MREQNVLLTRIYIQFNYVIEQAAVNEQQKLMDNIFCLYQRPQYMSHSVRTNTYSTPFWQATMVQ